MKASRKNKDLIQRIRKVGVNEAFIGFSPYVITHVDMAITKKIFAPRTPK